MHEKGERAISFKKFVSLVTEKNLFTSDKQKKFGEDVQTCSQVFILRFYFYYKKQKTSGSNKNNFGFNFKMEGKAKDDQNSVIEMNFKDFDYLL